jgi:hypothetical protein
MLSEKSPIILRKSREVGETVGQCVKPNDPYLAYFKENGLKTPIDVKARLDQMMYMGGVEHSINGTQISVESAMINRGHSDEEIVEVVLAATRVAAGDYGKRWNWRFEERKIRSDIARWRVKLGKEGKEPTPAPDRLVPSLPSQDSQSSNVIYLNNSGSGAVALRQPKSKTDTNRANVEAAHIKIGMAVINVIKDRGDDLLFTEKTAWYCEGGLWRMMTDGASWLTAVGGTSIEGKRNRSASSHPALRIRFPRGRCPRGATRAKPHQRRSLSHSGGGG